MQCVAKCWERLKTTYTHPVRVYEGMLNANAFGTEGNLHHDIDYPDARARHHTVLVDGRRVLVFKLWAG